MQWHRQHKDVNTLFEGRKGKVLTKLLPNKKSINANKHIAGLNQKDWKKVNLRNGTKGALEVETYTKRVYLWDGVENTCVSKMLIVSRKKDSKGQWEYKYAFSNAKDNQFTIDELVYMQCDMF